MPADGETLGEVMFRGNIVMKGYLKNPKATQEAFAGGWFHSGDLGVMHPDGYIQLKDRSKDIIISGGENISSLEVEDVLMKHPAVMFAAVVARPDEKWGETPCAFIEKKPGQRWHCRHGADRLLPRTWRTTRPAPRRVRRTPQDLHRQDPEIQAARDGEGARRSQLTKNAYKRAIQDPPWQHFGLLAPNTGTCRARQLTRANRACTLIGIALSFCFAEHQPFCWQSRGHRRHRRHGEPCMRSIRTSMAWRSRRSPILPR